MENKQVSRGSFLDHLTKGLYDAVVQAQALAENQHIEALNKFINDDGTPKCMKIFINGEYADIPLITLAPQSSIKIKELKMDLKVKLNNFGKRKSRKDAFCARMGGMKRRLTSAKTARDPNSRINKALRKWNC